MHHRRPVILAAALAASAVAAPAAVAAPRATKPSATQLLAKSRAALAGAATFTANGFTMQGTTRTGFVIRSAERGNDADGRLSTTTPAGTAQLGFVRLGSRLYIEGNRRFWIDSLGSSASTVASSLVGHWFEVPGSRVASLAGTIGAFSNPARIAGFISSDTADGPYWLGAATHEHGHAVVPVVSHDQVLDVSANAAALPQSLSVKGTSGTLAIVFAYPAHLSITAPRGAKPLTSIATSTTTTSSSTTSTTTTSTSTTTTTSAAPATS